MSATTTREKPILFRGEMVRAIIAGRKSMTRRVVKPQPFEVSPRLGKTPGLIRVREADPTLSTFGTACPYGKPGDRLWVRETWQAVPIGRHRDWSGIPDGRLRTPCPGRETVAAIYRADGEMPGDEIWQPSIFMPRWACRIVLEITDVRVERLNDISANDALDEGVGRTEFWKPSELEGRPFEEKWWDDYEFSERYPPLVFRKLWESIHGVGSWAKNPFVWVIEFKRLDTKGGA